ncbi:MAG: hypothetical protein LBO79_06265 [Zoogloeaceae bacterium]|nr:hypothetical protein [Zoogloeaceae bacterium]
MYSPKPYGRFGNLGSDPAADALVEAITRQMTNLKEVSSLPGYKLVRRVRGYTVIAWDMGGLRRTLVIPPEEQREEDEDVEFLPGGSLPMLFSGRVMTTRTKGETAELRVTNQTRHRLIWYGEKRDKDNKPLPLPPLVLHRARFKVPISDALGEFRPLEDYGWFHTQYGVVMPSLYSGSMKAVVQAILGFGRQSGLPEAEAGEVLRLPSEVVAANREALEGAILPGYRGRPVDDGAVTYDYKWVSTHGVGYGQDQQPWLMRLSTSGLEAMPLPLIPETTTTAFRAWIEDVGDGEILWLLDRFGGMPTGEAFPSGEMKEEWKRAGVLVHLAEATPAYMGTAYSSMHGAAWNLRGTELVKTGWRGPLPNGLIEGYMVQASFSFAPLPNGGRARLDVSKLPAQDQAKTVEYVAEMRAALAGRAWAEPALYKICSTPPDELAARARDYAGRANPNPEAEAEWWHQHQMPPGGHAGSLREVYSGNITSPLPVKSQEQAKYPELLPTRALYSFNFTAEDSAARALAARSRSDIVITAWYQDDVLKVVKKFRDPRPRPAQTTSSAGDDCQIVGGNTTRVEYGEGRTMGEFYTTDFDPRESSAGTWKETEYSGVYLGPTDWSGGIAPIVMTGYIGRSHAVGTRTVWREMHDYELKSAVAFPMFARECALFAQTAHAVQRVSGESSEPLYVADPYSYFIWTFDWNFHWYWDSEIPASSMKGTPYPVGGDRWYAEVPFYKPDIAGCTSFADQGPWLTVPQDVLELPVVPDPATHWPRFSRQKVDMNVADAAGKLHSPLYTGELHKSPDPWFFDASPDPETGLVFHASATWNCAGDTEFLTVMEQGKAARSWGQCALAAPGDFPSFFGVVSE